MVHRDESIEEERATSEGQVAAILVPGNMGTWEGVCDTLNRLVRG